MTTVRVHAINDPELGPEQFHITQDVFMASLEEHPDLRDRVVFSESLGPDGDADEVAKADILVGWSFSTNVIERAQNVKWFHVIGAGFDHLEPLDWMPKGVTLTNSSGVHAARAGEYVATALLMFNSLMPMHLEDQQAKLWNPRYSTVITGKTVAIIGVGSIGGSAAERAKGLGLHVKGVRHSGAPHPFVDEMFRTDQLHEAIDGADFVAVCAALTDETHGLIGRRELEMLPAHAGIVNTSREPLVDYDALAELLREGRLGGAILDVFEPEPLAEDSPLWHCPRLIITPHVSSDPSDYTPSMLKIFNENLNHYLNDTPMRNIIVTA